MFRISNTLLTSGIFSTTTRRLCGTLGSRSFSSIEGCSACGMEAKHIDEYMKEFQQQIKENGYINNPKALPRGKCQALRSDEFQGSEVCVISRKLDVYARIRLAEMGIEIGETALLIPSALLREPEKEKEGLADLTGDSGQSSIKILKELHQASVINIDEIKTIVDIGGLDTSFVQNFDTHEKVVNDINLLTPLLSNPNITVEFLIGLAEEVLNKSSILNQENRGPVLFNMSNLLSVLPPDAAFKLIHVIRSHMKPGDLLSITNLDQKQFETRQEFTVCPDHDEQGLKEVRKKQGRFYKTVVDLPSFTKQMEKSGFDVLKSESITRDIRVLGKRSFPGFFIAAIFKAV